MNIDSCSLVLRTTRSSTTVSTKLLVSFLALQLAGTSVPASAKSLSPARNVSADSAASASTPNSPISLLLTTPFSVPSASFPATFTSAVPATSTPIATPSPQTVAANTPDAAPIEMTAEQLGDLHMARKRYQAAIEAYHKAALDSPSVWNKLGLANQQMFILSEAKKDYETALKLDPKNPDVLNNLATIYYASKDYAYAERFYRRALKLEPKSAIIYKNLGTDLIAEDKLKKGWQAYQSALSIDPQVFERENQYRVGEPTAALKRGAMNYFLAKSYAHLGKYDLAIGYLRMAIDEGYTDRRKIIGDSEFASLKGLPAFEELLSAQRVQ